MSVEPQTTDYVDRTKLRKRLYNISTLHCSIILDYFILFSIKSSVMDVCLESSKITSKACIGFLLLVGVDECSNECDDNQWTGTGFG